MTEERRDTDDKAFWDWLNKTYGRWTAANIRDQMEGGVLGNQPIDKSNPYYQAWLKTQAPKAPEPETEGYPGLRMTEGRRVGKWISLGTATIKDPADVLGRETIDINIRLPVFPLSELNTTTFIEAMKAEYAEYGEGWADLLAQVSTKIGAGEGNLTWDVLYAQSVWESSQAEMEKAGYTWAEIERNPNLKTYLVDFATKTAQGQTQTMDINKLEEARLSGSTTPGGVGGGRYRPFIGTKEEAKAAGEIRYIAPEDWRSVGRYLPGEGEEGGRYIAGEEDMPEARALEHTRWLAERRAEGYRVPEPIEEAGIQRELTDLGQQKGGILGWTRPVESIEEMSARAAAGETGGMGAGTSERERQKQAERRKAKEWEELTRKASARPQQVTRF